MLREESTIRGSSSILNQTDNILSMAPLYVESRQLPLRHTRLTTPIPDGANKKTVQSIDLPKRPSQFDAVISFSVRSAQTQRDADVPPWSLLP